MSQKTVLKKLLVGHNSFFKYSKERVRSVLKVSRTGFSLGMQLSAPSILALLYNHFLRPASCAKLSSLPRCQKLQKSASLQEKDIGSRHVEIVRPRAKPEIFFCASKELPGHVGGNFSPPSRRQKFLHPRNNGRRLSAESFQRCTT